MATWDADIARYERATGEVLPRAYYRMTLEDMCPERLHNRLRDWAERWPTIDDLRQQIADWISEEASRALKGEAIGAVSAPEVEVAEDE